MKNTFNIDYSLYLVTDRDISGNRDLCKCIEEAIQGGVTLIQLREKDISTLDFCNIALKVKKVTDKYNIPLIINDRLDIALAIGATGLHVGQSDMPAHIARRLLGNNKVLGVSAATLEEAIKAEEDGADYLGVGAVFPTSSKNDARSVKLELLSKIKKSVDIPVVGIGGINERNIKDVIKTGVDGAAVISAILSKQNIKEASQSLIDLIKEKK